MNLRSLPALLLSAFSLPAFAVPIVFTFSGTADIYVGGTLRPSTSFVVSLQAQTEDRQTVTTLPLPIYFYSGLVGDLQITGLGTGTFSDALNVFNNQNSSTAGLNENSSGDLFGISSGVLANYGLASTIAAFSGIPYSPTPSASAPTSFGTVTFTNFSAMTFSASPTPVPEAAASTMFLVGAIALALTRLRRRERACEA